MVSSLRCCVFVLFRHHRCVLWRQQHQQQKQPGVLLERRWRCSTQHILKWCAMINEVHRCRRLLLPLAMQLIYTLFLTAPTCLFSSSTTCVEKLGKTSGRTLPCLSIGRVFVNCMKTVSQSEYYAHLVRDRYLFSAWNLSDARRECQFRTKIIVDNRTLWFVNHRLFVPSYTYE